ncbi:hypothetical protein B0920_14680 [Massilia sp. KIM]|uniref:hypothetical protein n=1 Tax=Massilia sp. KIM TaxID=1955422 RepID=UPI00098F13D0|nr:hypothetical protein [Massilia sp. KIM]OON64517.1 hypothetical protein B0920_14680 [Massilia sp. KIM]
MTTPTEFVQPLVTMRHRYSSLASSFKSYFIEEVNRRVGAARKLERQLLQLPPLPNQSNAPIKTMNNTVIQKPSSAPPQSKSSKKSETELAKAFRIWVEHPTSSYKLQRLIAHMVDHELAARLSH